MPLRVGWGGWSASDAEASVEIAPDLRLPKYLDAYVIDEPDLEVDLHLAIVYDPAAERYVTDVLQVRRRAPGGDVTGTDLRAIRVQDFVRQAIRQALRHGRDHKDSPLFGVEFELASNRAAEIRALGPSSAEAMRWTARIYKFAAALNERPAKAVQEQLGLTVPNASVWIRRARDTGVLVHPEPEPDMATAQEAFERARRVSGTEPWQP